MKTKKNRARYTPVPSRLRTVMYSISLVFIAFMATAAVVWFLLDDVFTDGMADTRFAGEWGRESGTRDTITREVSTIRYAGIKAPGGLNASERRPAISSASQADVSSFTSSRGVGDGGEKRLVSRPSEGSRFVKLPEARTESLLASGKNTREPKAGTSSRRAPESPRSGLLPTAERRSPVVQPVRVYRERVVDEYSDMAFAVPAETHVVRDGGGLFTLNLNGDDYPAHVESYQPAQVSQKNNKPRRNAPAIASDNAYANPYGKQLEADDLFSLKLHAVYGRSKADFEDPALGNFEDRFLVLGGDKKLDFAGMDEMNFALDGVITTSGKWDTDSRRQDLSGFTLNGGLDLKLPELPISFDTNLGVGWLKRESTLYDHKGDYAKADIDSFVYGGGLAMRGDWQWRMLKLSGMAGVQYAAANDKSHQYKTLSDKNYGKKIPKETSSAWEIPLQLRASGEYRLLDALSVSPAIWGGYTYNVSGKNGPFHSGHIAGAENTWRRNGMTWNKSSWHVGAEMRVNIVDRINLWFDYQKEWAGGDKGTYYGGGLQVAF